LNEIDGFLQVTTEFLTLTAQRIQRQDATQAKILDAFIEEVTIRLIEMTDAWDNHAVLLAAVRRAQKRKNTLRQELLAIRRERAEIQREMEAVRQAHEIGEKEMADIKRQQDFIGDMEDLRARIGVGDEEDQVKVWSLWSKLIIERN
jgi:IS1 family transposase